MQRQSRGPGPLPRHGQRRTLTSAPAQAPSQSDVPLAYKGVETTWYTHWQRYQEQQEFKQQVHDAQRSRKAQRQQNLWSILEEDEGEAGASGSYSSSEDYNSTAFNGRLSFKPQAGAADSVEEGFCPGGSSNGSGSGSVTGAIDGEGLDDLTWLASHPEAVGPCAAEEGIGEPQLQVW